MLKDKILWAAILAVAFVILSLFALDAFAKQETCPTSDGWTKIDSDDLSTYPVDGATAYCFKAGSDHSKGCTGGLFRTWPQPEGTCGLSHWAYFIPEVTPTVTPTDVPRVTPTPTPRHDCEECEPTPTPTKIPEVTPTTTPQPTSEPKKEEPQSNGVSKTSYDCPNTSPVKVGANFHVLRKGGTAIMRWVPTEGDNVNIYYYNGNDSSDAHAVREILNTGEFTINELGTKDWTFGLQQANACAGGPIVWIIDGPTDSWVMFR